MSVEYNSTRERRIHAFWVSMKKHLLGGCGMENKLASFFMNFLIRAIIGMAAVFFINQYIIPDQAGWHVGLNMISFLTTGSLGIPGVCLLYGILLFQSL